MDGRSQNHTGVIRVFNSDTGKVKEYSYKQANAANKKYNNSPPILPMKSPSLMMKKHLLRAVVDDGEG